ncbi:MAG: ERCC4 domain-containing protein [Candidatus Jordarchaeum sp.]|uniref:ERCC4 domain-containing protein n=1 Tax=Candidatus Jordarchaeum sp. TaxID=2823881 RepID=UPI00404A54DA
MIIVDNHEKRSIVPEKLEKFEVKVQFADLPAGDYLINGIICVERKEINDYITSLTSGHLHTQLYNLSTNFEVSYLIVEGLISEALMYRKIKREAYLSSLAGASIKRSPEGKKGIVQIINLETAFDTALFLKSLNDRLEETEPRIPQITRVKRGAKDQLIFIVSSLPGIGEIRARKLLEHFGDMKNLVNANLDKIASIPGIGIKTARELHNIFVKKYDGRT